MAFTSVTLTGTVELQPSQVAVGATVTALLSTPITDGSQLLSPQVQAATTNGSGQFSLTVPANDDTTTLPTGTYYTITITSSGGSQIDKFNVIVPHADAPTVDVFTLATLSNPNVQTPYVSTFNGRNGTVALTTADLNSVLVGAVGGAGDNLSYSGATTTGQILQLYAGSAASPDSTLDAVFKISRTASLLSANVTGDAVEQASAGGAIISGTATNQVQVVGLYGIAENYGSAFGLTDSPDAAGLYGVGRALGSSVGVAMGIYLRSDVESSTARGSAMQVDSHNNRGTNDTVSPAGFGPTVAAWIWASGANQSAAGHQFGNPFNQQFGTGIHFTQQIPTYRSDLCSTTTSSNVITDPSVQSSDAIGTVVSGANIPGGSYITSVTPGVSFTINNNVTTGSTQQYVAFKTSRTDTSCGTTIGSTTVTDTSCVASDLGRIVTGAGIVNGSIITGVTPGTSFTINNAASATASGVTLTISLAGPTSLQDFRTDSLAPTAILISGGHSTAAIAVAQGSGAVLIGETTAAQASSILEVVPTPNADTRPFARFGNGAGAHNYSFTTLNSSGTMEFFMSAGPGNVITGTAAGDGGVKIATANKAWHVGAGSTTPTSVIKVANTTATGALAFFNATAVAQPGAYTLNAGSTSRNLPSGATTAQLEACLRQFIADMSASNGGNGLVG